MRVDFCNIAWTSIPRYAAAMILKIAYGHEVHSVDDRFVRLGECCHSKSRNEFTCQRYIAERAATLTVQSGSPAATLVDFFPALRYVRPHHVNHGQLERSLISAPSSRHIPTWAPFSSFKKNALETRKAVKDMMEVPFKQVVSEMASACEDLITRADDDIPR